ncbi:homoserine acetyltransferase [Bradyrhizobium sp. S3.3.6]
MTGQRDHQIFEAGNVALQSGAVFLAMKLAYQTYGTLSAAKDNLILNPTTFSAQQVDTEWLIGSDGVLDPARYFIVIPSGPRSQHFSASNVGIRS